MKKYRMFRETAWGRGLVWIMAFLMFVFPAMPVWALPNGETVVHGDVTFETSGSQMVVNQATDQAIVNYNGFNIAGGEGIQFVQPGSGAAILNRVTGGGSSTIAGQMSANGRVFLINPNGVLFTSSAQVDVGALVASALNMSDSDFLAGRLRFSGGGGSVVNEGSLHGRFVGLIGGSVENRGSISAGDVVLAAGSSVVIDRAGDGQIRVTIDGAVADPEELENNISAESTPEEVAASESGSGNDDSVAAAGTGEESSVGTTPESGMTSNGESMADALTASNETIVANASAEVAALIDQSAQSQSGDLLPGTVVNQGVIQVSGDVGGTVLAQGAQVSQMGTIHADGLTGSGGSITLLASDVVVVGAESITTANAGLNGDGGQIVIVGEDTAIIATGARIEARGGSESGNGGFVETSGHRNFQIGSMPDVSANAGRGGTWLIDPTDISIVGGTGLGIGGSPVTENTLYADDISSFLENIGSLSITTDSLDPELGIIDWQSGANVSWTTANDLALFADNNIVFDGTILATLGNVDFLAGGDIAINNALSTGGNVGLTATGGSISGAGLVTADMLTVNAAGAIDLQTAANAIGFSAGGDVAIAEADAVTVAGSTTANDGLIDVQTANGTLTVGTVGAQTGLTADGSGSVTLVAGGAGSDVAVNEAVASTSGNIEITAANSVATSAKIETDGRIDILAQNGSIAIGGAIDPSVVTLTAAGDVDVDAAVEADDSITVVAGTDGTGSININVAGSLETLAADSDISLTAGSTAGDINLAGSVTALDTVDLTADAGGISQSAGTVAATSLAFSSGGSVTLANLAVSSATGTSMGNVALSNAGALEVLGLDSGGGDIDVVATLGLTVSGLIASLGGDIDLSGQSILFNAGVNAGLGDLDLTATGGDITQTAGTLLASALVLDVTGNATLDAANDFDSVAGAVTGDLELNDADGLDLAGIDAANLDLTTGGNLTDSAANAAGALVLDVTGNATLDAANDFDSVAGAVTGDLELNDADGLDLAGIDAANLDLTTGGNLTDSAANAAGALVLDVTGNATLDAANDFDSVAGAVTGDLELNDADEIELSNLDTSNGSITVTAGGQITAADVTAGGTGNISLTTTGDINLAGDITAEDSNILFVSGGAIDQFAGRVASENLAFDADGHVNLSGANLVDTLAGTAGDAITYVNDQDLEVGTVGAYSGLATTLSNISVDANGTLTINQVIETVGGSGGNLMIGGGTVVNTNINVGAGSIFLNNGGAGVDILISSLLSLSGGSVTLSAPRDIVIWNNGQIALNGTGSLTLLANANFGLVADSLGAAYGGVYIGGQGVSVADGNLIVHGSELLAGRVVDPGVVIGSDTAIYLHGGNQIDPSAPLVSASGDVTLNGTGADGNAIADVVVDGSVDAQDDVAIMAGRDVVLSANVAAADDVDVSADGAITWTGGTVTADVLTASAANGISLNTAVGTLNATNAAGNIAVTEADGILLGNVHAGNGSVAVAAGNTITAQTVWASQDVGLTNLAGDILVGSVTAGNAATLNSQGAIAGGAVTAGVLNAYAANGISLNTAVGTLNATNAAGNIAVTEADGILLGNVHAGNGSVAVAAGNTITAQTVWASQDVGLTNLAGDILVGSVTAGNAATLNSQGAIAGGAVTAGVLNAYAANGINLNTAVGTLNATNAAGNIAVTEADGILLGNVQAGNGSVAVTAGSTITALTVRASQDVGLTNLAGDILVGSVTAGNAATLNSQGAIEEAGADAGADLTAAVLDLNAQTGIGAAGAIETASGTISADTVNGNIDLDNASASATTATSLTTGAGNILFSQTGGGALEVTTATTTGGNIGIDVAGADLTAGTVTAGGAGDVALTTTGSGDVRVDNVTADGNAITVTAAGAIEESGTDAGADLTAAVLDLNAQAGIGKATNRLESAADTIEFAAGGDVYLTESDAVTVAGATANNGRIDIQTANGTLTVGTVGVYTGLAADGSGSVRLVAGGTGSDVVLNQAVTSESGNICVIAANDVEFPLATSLLQTGGNGAIAVWAQAGNVNQTAGSVQTANGNVYVSAGTDVNQAAGSAITAGGANNALAVYAGNAMSLAGNNTAANLALGTGTGDIVVDTVLNHSTIIMSAGRDIIGTGSGQVVANQMGLHAGNNIGAAGNRLKIDAGTLAAEANNMYLHELNNVTAGNVNGLNLAAVPPCAAGMPIPNTPPPGSIHATGAMDLLVDGRLSGDSVVAGGDANIQAATIDTLRLLDVGGSLNSLNVAQDAKITDIRVGNQADIGVGGNLTSDSFRSGREAVLDVRGNTDIASIQAGGRFQLSGGGNFAFNSLNANTVQADVRGSIMMGQVNAGTASFGAGGSVTDRGSMLNVGNISIRAGGNIGSAGSAINLNVATIGNISGNNIYLSQNRSGSLNVNTITAQGFLDMRVPNGQILDGNDVAGQPILNITAASALFDAEQIGARANPLELKIPGTITLQNSSGRPFESSYIWAHLSNEEKNGEIKPNYSIGVPGLVIQNNQVVGGEEGVMREIFRTEAFFVETPELKSRQGVFGSPYFLHGLMQISEPVALGLIDYALYGQAQVNADPDLPSAAKRTISKGGYQSAKGQAK